MARTGGLHSAAAAGLAAGHWLVPPTGFAAHLASHLLEAGGSNHASASLP